MVLVSPPMTQGAHLAAAAEIAEMSGRVLMFRPPGILSRRAISDIRDRGAIDKKNLSISPKLEANLP